MNKLRWIISEHKLPRCGNQPGNVTERLPPPDQVPAPCGATPPTFGLGSRENGTWEPTLNLTPPAARVSLSRRPLSLYLENKTLPFLT